jgi:NTE family protein
MGDAPYFESLVRSMTRVACHAHYPGKEDAVDLCLEEVEELGHSGRIDGDQVATLRDILLGREPPVAPQAARRGPDRAAKAADPTRIAIACQGVGSHAAFTAGVLQGLIERQDDGREMIALSGTSGGAICALLAWDGLLRGDPQLAVDQLQRFWRHDTATSLFDAVLGYSARMAWLLRPVVGLPGLLPGVAPPWGREPLGRLIELRGDFAEDRSLAVREGAPGLVVGVVDPRNGAIEVVHGPRITADHILASAAIPQAAPSSTFDGRSHGEGLFPQDPPVRELTDYRPDEIWVIQVKRVHHRGMPGTSGDLPGRSEPVGNLSLDRELRFIQKINDLLGRGVLIGGGYRHIEVHRIVIEHDLDHASKYDRSGGFLSDMMAYGRERAGQFLAERDRRLKTPSPDYLRV